MVAGGETTGCNARRSCAPAGARDKHFASLSFQVRRPIRDASYSLDATGGFTTGYPPVAPPALQTLPITLWDSLSRNFRQ